MRSEGRTLKELANSLAGEEDLDFWFQWPPDLFALTSLALIRTGIYRFAASPPPDKEWPEKPDWMRVVEECADEWICSIGGNCDQIKLLEDNKKTLEASWNSLSLMDLRRPVRGSKNPLRDEEWSLISALLELHAISDEACRGFGLPLGGASNRRHRRAVPKSDAARPVVFLHANRMLCVKGSLSRLPTSELRVLPKMRVPQSGLTVRSLSHHVTVHRSEVDVIWRTAPWVNRDENILNVLVVPWPFEVGASAFKPFSMPFVRRASSEPHRFFKYDPPKGRPSPASVVSDMIRQAQKECARIHMVVLPEQALTDDELRELRNLLARRWLEPQKDEAGEPRAQPPVIITGLRQTVKISEGSSVPRNRVVLSVYFGGKWYEMRQDKHHRWKLDSAQIQTYRLSGVLSPERSWWEAIEIPDRRISFFSPSTWMTLCPLICEDLARLEPVSDMIRGVGPTLAIAILLDGPQLGNRWSSRYASVLADDPGTSVLSVTSLGMALRSLERPLDPLAPRHSTRGRSVALWKDQISGARELSLGDGHHGVVLGLSATLSEEYSADGRGDGGAASLFVLRQVQLLGSAASENDPDSKASAFEYLVSRGEDLLELSLFAFFLDAALSAPDLGCLDTLRKVCLTPAGVLQELSVDEETVGEVAQLLTQDRMPSRPGASDLDFHLTIEWASCKLKAIFRRSEFERNPDGESRLRALFQAAKNILARANKVQYRENFEAGGDPLRDSLSKLPLSEVLRLQTYVGLGLLWALHKRVSARRRRGLTRIHAELLNAIEGQLGEPWEHHWVQVRRDERRDSDGDLSEG